MKICVLASGSKGNSTYIEYKDTHILIDLGTTSSYVEKNLNSLGIDPSNIDGILITHTHGDHIKGLKTFVKKYNTPLYLTEKMLEDINIIFTPNKYILIDDSFYLKDLKVRSIKISHDVTDANGYIIEGNDRSLVYITDTGYINYKNHQHLKNKNVYIMESNHDVEMLMDGSYPYYLKQRVLSDKGHLSNISSSTYLSKFIGENTHDIILAHLSQENNTEEKALTCLKEKLKEENLVVENISIARQNEKTELIEV